MQALSLSADLAGLVDDTRTFRAHSVFPRVANLATPSGDWVTLACPEVGNLPRGIVLDASLDFDFTQHMRTGLPVVLAEGWLTVGDMRIDLSGAHVWEPCLAPGSDVPWAYNWAERWARAWATLQAHAPPESLPAAAHTPARDGLPPLTRLIGQAVERLFSTCRALESERAGAAASALIGLGPGLTPSGDDLLVGLLAGLWLRYPRSNGAQRVFVQHLAWQVGKSADRTTDVSRIYLLSAVRGCVAQKLKDLATSIVAPSVHEQEALEDVEWRTLNALAVGSTSGADGVYGLLLGLQLWGERASEEHRFAGREPALGI